jgi:drug/metabolite transporter (DMT)-like permease
MNLDFIWLILVGAVWGITNPFMKKGSDGITEIRDDNKKFFKQIIFLFTRWKYLLALGLNQMGSVLFYLSLSNTNLSIVVPITNSVTFIFTAIVSKLIGENQNMGNKCKSDSCFFFVFFVSYSKNFL